MIFQRVIMKMIKMTTSRWENQIVKTNEEIRKDYVSIELKSYPTLRKNNKEKKKCQYSHSSFSFRPMG